MKATFQHKEYMHRIMQELRMLEELFNVIYKPLICTWKVEKVGENGKDFYINVKLTSKESGNTLVNSSILKNIDLVKMTDISAIQFYIKEIQKSFETQITKLGIEKICEETLDKTRCPKCRGRGVRLGEECEFCGGSGEIE